MGGWGVVPVPRTAPPSLLPASFWMPRPGCHTTPRLFSFGCRSAEKKSPYLNESLLRCSGLVSQQRLQAGRFRGRWPGEKYRALESHEPGVPARRLRQLHPQNDADKREPGRRRRKSGDEDAAAEPRPSLTSVSSRTGSSPASTWKASKSGGGCRFRQWRKASARVRA